MLNRHAMPNNDRQTFLFTTNDYMALLSYTSCLLFFFFSFFRRGKKNGERKQQVLPPLFRVSNAFAIRSRHNRFVCLVFFSGFFPIVSFSSPFCCLSCLTQAANQQDPVQGPLLHAARPRQERESLHPISLVIYLPFFSLSIPS